MNLTKKDIYYFKWLAIVIFIFGFLLLRPYHLQQTGLMYLGDDESYFAHASSLAFFQFPSYKNEGHTCGKKMPAHSIGAGIMAAPFVFVFSQIDRLNGSAIIQKRQRENIFQSWSIFGFVFSTMIYFLLTILFLYFALRFNYSEKASFFSILFMILFQFIPLYIYRRPVFTHIYEIFLQGVFLYILVKDQKTNFLDDAKNRFFVMMGILAGLIFLVRLNNIFMAHMWPLVIIGLKDNYSISKKIKSFIYVFVSAFILVFIFRLFPSLVNGKEAYVSVEEFFLKFR